MEKNLSEFKFIIITTAFHNIHYIIHYLWGSLQFELFQKDIDYKLSFYTESNFLQYSIDSTEFRSVSSFIMSQIDDTVQAPGSSNLDKLHLDLLCKGHQHSVKKCDFKVSIKFRFQSLITCFEILHFSPSPMQSCRSSCNTCIKPLLATGNNFMSVQFFFINSIYISNHFYQQFTQRTC